MIAPFFNSITKKKILIQLQATIVTIRVERMFYNIQYRSNVLQDHIVRFEKTLYESLHKKYRRHSYQHCYFHLMHKRGSCNRNGTTTSLNFRNHNTSIFRSCGGILKRPIGGAVHDYGRVNDILYIGWH